MSNVLKRALYWNSSKTVSRKNALSKHDPRCMINYITLSLTNSKFYFLNFIFYSNYCTLKTTSDLLVQSEREALNNLQATETTIGYFVPLKY
jgi:hypothetical protein